MNASGLKVNSDSTFLIDKSAYKGGDPFAATGGMPTKTQIGFKAKELLGPKLVKEDKNEDAATPHELHPGLISNGVGRPMFKHSPVGSGLGVSPAEEEDAIDRIARMTGQL